MNANDAKEYGKIIGYRLFWTTTVDAPEKRVPVNPAHTAGKKIPECRFYPTFKCAVADLDYYLSKDMVFASEYISSASLCAVRERRENAETVRVGSYCRTRAEAEAGTRRTTP